MLIIIIAHILLGDRHRGLQVFGIQQHVADLDLIRAHELLNNLHDKLDDKPMVLFYPGKYNMQELMLFGMLEANYYRAFRLVE